MHMKVKESTYAKISKNLCLCLQLFLVKKEMKFYKNKRDLLLLNRQ